MSPWFSKTNCGGKMAQAIISVGIKALTGGWVWVQWAATGVMETCCLERKPPFHVNIVHDAYWLEKET